MLALHVLFKGILPFDSLSEQLVLDSYCTATAYFLSDSVVLTRRIILIIEQNSVQVAYFLYILSILAPTCLKLNLQLKSDSFLYVNVIGPITP